MMQTNTPAPPLISAPTQGHRQDPTEGRDQANNWDGTERRKTPPGPATALARHCAAICQLDSRDYGTVADMTQGHARSIDKELQLPEAFDALSAAVHLLSDCLSGTYTDRKTSAAVFNDARRHLDRLTGRHQGQGHQGNGHEGREAASEAPCS